MVEYETRKYLQAKKELEERNTNLNFLVITGHKISDSLNLKKIVRGGFAGLVCLLPIKKGFVLLPSLNEKWEVAATYHLTSIPDL